MQALKLNADLAFLNACLYDWCCTDTFVLSLSVHICVLVSMWSLSLPIVCVVFPSLHVHMAGAVWTPLSGLSKFVHCLL